MARVNSIVDHDVADLVDDDYVQQRIQADVYITFACVAPNNRKDDQWVKNGKTYLVIQLSYEQVKASTRAEVRQLMLDKALERLREVA